MAGLVSRDVRITFRLDGPLHEELKRSAAKEGITVAEMLRKLVIRHCDSQPPARHKNCGISHPHAPTRACGGAVSAW
jgi:hypothetical protein